MDNIKSNDKKPRCSSSFFFLVIKGILHLSLKTLTNSCFNGHHKIRKETGHQHSVRDNKLRNS